MRKVYLCRTCSRKRDCLTICVVEECGGYKNYIEELHEEIIAVFKPSAGCELNMQNAHLLRLLKERLEGTK